MLPEFRNEPLTDFSDPANVAAFQSALDAVRGELGRSYPMLIGGQQVTAAETFDSINPSCPSQVVGRFPVGTVEHADQAVEAARCAFESWQHTLASDRAALLVRVAGEMRRRKHEFSATMVYEVGKPWIEADADTAEAIDFLEYYTRQILEIADSSSKLVTPLERGQLYYIPLGVGAVIAPWNFPNAILIGMASAAIVSGNTVVLKSAEQGTLIAWKVVSLFKECGLPDGVLNFITGHGSVIGSRIVEHPTTRFIAFTGSLPVGVASSARRSCIRAICAETTVLELAQGPILATTRDLDARAESSPAPLATRQNQRRQPRIMSIRFTIMVDRVGAHAQLTVAIRRDRSITRAGDRRTAHPRRCRISDCRAESTLLTGAMLCIRERRILHAPRVRDVERSRLRRKKSSRPCWRSFARDFDHACISRTTDSANGRPLPVILPNWNGRARFMSGNLYLSRRSRGRCCVHPFCV